MGAPFTRRFARLDEQVATMRAVWAGEIAVEGVPPIGPEPVQPGGPPLWTAAMGPKSLARSARWADGLAGFDLEGVDRQFRAVEAAWRDAGRTEVPTLTTSTWFALGDGAEDRLYSYAFEYLSTFGPDAAKAMAGLTRLKDPGAIRDAVAALADVGCDEFVLVPTTADVSEIDRSGRPWDSWRSTAGHSNGGPPRSRPPRPTRGARRSTRWSSRRISAGTSRHT